MKKFFRWCRRYLSMLTILVAAFVCYTLLFQDKSMFTYMENARIIDSLQTEIKNATDTMEFYQKLNSQLNSDPELMERVVREQYNMVREGEDVYVYR